jgi:hypothetical protein
MLPKVPFIAPEDIVSSMFNDEYVVVLKKIQGENIFKLMIKEKFDKAYLGYYDFSSGSVTNIEQSGTWYKLNSDTVSDFSRNGIVHTNNRATNIGNKRVFKVEAIASLQAGNNQQIHLAFYKNGTTLLSCTEQSVNTGLGNRISALPIHCLAELGQNEFIEVWVKNETSANNVTTDNLNVIIQEL